MADRKSLLPAAPNRFRAEIEKALVGFIVGNVRYAIDIVQVREIVAPLPLTELPHTPKDLAGVANHRSEVLPVVDLRVRFGLEPRPQDRKKKWVLVTVGNRVIGLVVDHVLEVFHVAIADMRPPPDLGGGQESRGIASVVAHEGKWVFVLDVSRFSSLVESLDGFEDAVAAHHPRQDR